MTHISSRYKVLQNVICDFCKMKQLDFNGQQSLVTVINLSEYRAISAQFRPTFAKYKYQSFNYL